MYYKFTKAPSRRRSRTPFFQPKLIVNAPGDQYEQEANRIADHVVGSESSETPVPLRNQNTPLSGIQRTSAEPEQEEPESVQRKDTSGQSGSHTAPPIVGQVLASGSGQAMDSSTRHFMESRFGQDFGQVRIHTDSQAAESAAAIQARAYTSGRDVVFGAGEYKPDSMEGKRLLAHELVHVGQQRSGKSHGTIQPYRPKSAYNFGLFDDRVLKEDSFDSKKDKSTKPWIESIVINFTKKQSDSSGIEAWFGKMSVYYYKNPVAWADFSVDISGGSPALGLSDKGKFTVHRIEGAGYNSGKYSGNFVGVGPNKRYTPGGGAANMHYAVFYNGGEALHIGSILESSHGCIHVGNSVMKEINYHSVIGLTKVQVNYP